MTISMDPSVRYGKGPWEKAIVGKLLTDRKIRQYEKEGFYKVEARSARKELRDMRAFRHRLNQVSRDQEHMERISQNIYRAADGRLIYSPV